METTRFAPSPTGYLHLGHAFAAWVARQLGHRMLVRIEDIDGTRSSEAFTQAILEDLAWLEIAWDGEVVRQSERMEAYRSAVESLQSQSLLYPCFCTRKEIHASVEAPHGPAGSIYPGTCRERTPAERNRLVREGKPYALRLDVGACKLPPLFWEDWNGKRHTTEPYRFGDFVVARKETRTSYHLAVVVDDSWQGVSLVTRGKDLEEATHAQSVLQHVLGIAPPRYLHHHLVTDKEGRRLTKRDGDTAIRLLRERGWSPERVWAAVERGLGRPRRSVTGT
ncbi:MAG: tRNA glutamyl-Q(34) synthetase GluQRS [Fimbriimonadaceae bacterium]|nr:tRNA glutamyl-Q(34) synthetase GluQRS [Fimbriimonadaceae bacterium]